MLSLSLLSILTSAAASPASTSGRQTLSPQFPLGAPAEFPDGWRDPRIGGGSMIDIATVLLGEPINVIVSSNSDDGVLTEQGFRHYAQSLGYNAECLNQHMGGAQQADLGDGLGYRDQQIIFRQHYFPIFGTCWESLAGGHHFRAWKQNGTEANTGAWFLAASKEMNLENSHLIVPNGYNIGRDWLVERAVGGGHYKGTWWKADVEWREGLLEPGAKGINHNISQDGLVAILTVQKL